MPIFTYVHLEVYIVKWFGWIGHTENYMVSANGERPPGSVLK